MALFEYYVPNFSQNPSLLAILIILTVIAILLNANVIIGIIVKKRLHTFANILAVSLAIGDLILALSLCFLQSESEWNSIKQTANLKDTWLDRCPYTSNTTRMTSNIPTATCYNDFTIMLQDLVSMVVTTAQMAVILHLLVMTIDRYFAIVHPLTHYFYENYGISSQKKAIAICVLIWIVSLTFSAVYYIMFSGVTNPGDSTDTYVTTGYYAIITACLIITFFLNIPIVMTATVSTDLDKEQNSEGFASLLPQNKKMAVTFFLILTCISVGYTPDCIVYILRNNNQISIETFNVHYTYIVIVKLLTCILNPMIYGLRTFKVTFAAFCPKTQLKSTATLTTSVKTLTTSVKTTQKRGSKVGERRTTFQHSSSLLFKKRRESDQQKKRAIPKLIVVGVMLIYLFGTCAFLFINLNDKLEENEWPSDGALVVLGGCPYEEGEGCLTKLADVEVLVAPGLIPESCTVPPSFPVNSSNHGTVFFNNTIISCGLSSFWENQNRSCLTWRPGNTHWNAEYHLTTRMHNTEAVVTSYGAWFMDFGGEACNVLTNTEGNFEKRPAPTLYPRQFPCITVHPESDAVIVISGFMYKRNSTVEMYTGNMTFWRYLPQLNPPRQSHSCGSIGNFIVVAGGNGWKDDFFDSHPLTTVQVLNLASDEKWIEFPRLSNKMYDGIMANLLGSLVIVGGTEEILSTNSSLTKNTEKIEKTQPHNTSITNNFLLDYPFEHSSVVGILTTRKLGHSVVPLRINDICNIEN